MTDEPDEDELDLRDHCCWRGCEQLSDLIFYEAGLCDGHYVKACEVYLPTVAFVISHVIPEAAVLVSAQDAKNTAARIAKA